MANSFCTNCGAQVNKNATFCTTCGAPVNASNNNLAGQTRAMNVQGAGSQKKSTGLVLGIVIGAAVIVIALIVVFALVLPSMGAGSKNTSASVSPNQESSSSASSSTGITSTAQQPPVFTSIIVSSQLPGDSDTADYGAANLTDGNIETAWNEGAPGDGSGEWIRLSANTPQRVTSVSIVPGFPEYYKDGSDVYQKNNRPQEITISYNGGKEIFYVTDTRGQWQTFTFAEPVDTTELTITIDSVYKGTKFNECCIAELKVQ